MKRTDAMPNPQRSKRLLGGRDHDRVISQTEVIIGAEVEQLLISDPNPGRLRGADHRLGFVQALSLERAESSAS